MNRSWRGYHLKWNFPSCLDHIHEIRFQEPRVFKPILVLKFYLSHVIESQKNRWKVWCWCYSIKEVEVGKEVNPICCCRGSVKFFFNCINFSLSTSLGVSAFFHREVMKVTVKNCFSKTTHESIRVIMKALFLGVGKEIIKVTNDAPGGKCSIRDQTE